MAGRVALIRKDGLESSKTHLLDKPARRLMSYLKTLNHRLFLPRTHKLQGELRAKEWETLATLGFRGDQMMGDLAQALGVPLSSATRTVDRLVKKGLVVRSRSEQDRRIVRVDLSENGRKHEAAVSEQRVAMGRDMLIPLNPGERKLFLELMEKIARLAVPGETPGRGAPRTDILVQSEKPIRISGAMKPWKYKI